jgi:hypothetical protein
MRWFVLILGAALAAGCAKKTSSAPTPPAAPSDAAFAEDNPDNTLAWLAAQRTALNPTDDKNGDKFKAVAESMKGRSVNWPCTITHPNVDKTYGVTAFTLTADPPAGKSEEKREWRYVVVCKPLEPGAPIRDDDPLVRKQDPGFPLNPADWQPNAKAGAPVRLTGTVAAVQLHRKSWVTGYGIQDRVVHTEIGITLHLTDGSISPP